MNLYKKQLAMVLAMLLVLTSVLPQLSIAFADTEVPTGTDSETTTVIVEAPAHTVLF